MEKIGAYTERTTEGGEWRPGTPLTGQQATPMLASYFNMMQRELVTVVESAGIELDKDDDGQLLQAIRRLRGGAATNFGQWTWSNSLAGNPGAGRVALNHATPGSATRLFITEVSGEGVDFTQSLGLLRAGDTITLQERDSADLSHRFRVTGPTVDEGVYRAIPIEYVSGSGGRPAADGIVSVLLTQAGASDASIPLFMPQWWPNRASIPAGYAPADGQLLSRATFPEAWAGIQAGNVPTVADAVWLSTATERGKYTAGVDATSFRLPDYNGKSSGSIGAPFMRGDGALSAAVAGSIQQDAFQGHWHDLLNDNNLGIKRPSGGAVGNSGPTAANAPDTGTFMYAKGALTDGVNGTPRIASETRPLNVTGCWIIKIFGSVTNPGSVDAAQLASDFAGLVGRMADLENRPRGVGYGQTWQNVMTSRTAGTTYTNSTGMPIVVSVTMATGSGAHNLIVDGVVVGSNSFSPGVTSGLASGSCVTAIVPPNSTYSATGGISRWVELR